MIDIHKIIGIFCIADDFCKEFDQDIQKYQLSCDTELK